MSVATASKPPIASRAAPRLQARTPVASSSSSIASSSRPVVARPAAVSIRPPTKPNPAASSSSSVRSATKPPQPPATPSASTPAFLVPGKDTSSSSGKVFAKPSKEWVIPERAKPGRKVSVEEPDSKRQSQNRLSQRAHRARRTDYITTLEERIRQFENDEIHSNVRLQEVARALKADNERLKSEILSLRSDRSQSRTSPESFTPKGWEEERGMLLAEIKMLKEDVRRLRGMGDGGSVSDSGTADGGGHHLVNGGGLQSIPHAQAPALVRMRDRGGSMSVTPHPSSRITLTPTPIPIAGAGPIVVNGIKHIADCPICPDPDPDCPCQKIASSGLLNHTQAQYNQRNHFIRSSSSSHSHFHQPLSLSHVHRPDPSIPLGSTVGLMPSPPTATTSISCGFCQSTDECLCRVIDEEEEEDVKPIILTPPTESMRLDDGCGLCADGGFCACAVARNSPSGYGSAQIPHSILNSPVLSMSTTVATGVALPLKKLRSSGTVPTRKSIWALESGIIPAAAATTASVGTAGQSGTSRSEAVCSGDPSNCDACRNDTFGQEFCSNFFQARDPSHSCINCQGKCGSSSATSPATAGPSIPSNRASVPTASSKFWVSGDNPPVATDNAPTSGPSRPRRSLRVADNTTSNPTHHLKDKSPDHDQAHEEEEEAPITGPLLMACCGNPGLCGHSSGGCAPGDVVGIGGLIPGIAEQDIEKETIRVDQAWKKLKAHPNVKFASLAFLADVVAQRTVPTAGNGKSDGSSTPVPAPGAQEYKSSSPSMPARPQTGTLREIRSVEAEADVKGKKRMVVETSAVRDALRLLDGTPAPPSDIEEEEARGSKRLRLV